MAAAMLDGARAAPGWPSAVAPAQGASRLRRLQYAAGTAPVASEGESATVPGPPQAATPAPAPLPSPAALAPAAQSAIDKRGREDISKGVLEYLCAEEEQLIDTTKSPIILYLRGIYKGFQAYNHQVVIAIVAIVVGCLCAWDGPRVWQALFTASMVAAVTSLARIESEAWAVDIVSELLLMFQAAFATGVAVQSGFDGFQVLFGTLVGYLGAYGIGGWARTADHYAPGFAMLWYSIGAMLGALVLTIWQKPVLVTLGPLLGGFLVTTGVVCIACLLARAAGAKGTAILPVLHDPWINIAAEILFVIGPAALAAHAACAVTATVVYRATGDEDKRFPAVCCLLACIVVTAAVAAVEGAWWVVVACLIWGLISGLSTYRQLGLLQGWVPKSMSEVMETMSNAGSMYFSRSEYAGLPNNKKEPEGGSFLAGGLGFFSRGRQGPSVGGA